MQMKSPKLENVPFRHFKFQTSKLHFKGVKFHKISLNLSVDWNVVKPAVSGLGCLFCSVGKGYWNTEMGYHPSIVRAL